MCNGILNDPRVLCQHFFAEFITKHIFRVLSPNQPLYQELNMRWDERYNMHRKTFTFIPTCIPIRLKDGTQEFFPTAHRRGDLQFFMKYQHFGKSLVASALTCPHLRQFKTTKAFILATKCFGKWEKFRQGKGMLMILKDFKKFHGYLGISIRVLRDYGRITISTRNSNS